ncbi:RHS repeat-associated core domain-containing protein [Rothia nasimurium]|nr:RHS repeat-associated core domain-containing protein [Rothia nasimurium]
MSVAASSSSAAPGFGVTVAGSLQVAGLEILGVRAYDATSRGFISPDPLASPVGAGWASNAYAFVGNDPVGLVDPWGLSPMTASEFREYRADVRGRAGGWPAAMGVASALGARFDAVSGLGERVQGLIDSAPRSFDRLKTVASAMGNTLGELGKVAKITLPYMPAAARQWWDDNWQYVVAGATAAVALIALFTPAAPAGALILSGMGLGGGIELLFQGLSGEPLDYKKIANAASIGGWSNLVGGAFISSTVKVGPKLMTLANRSGAIGTSIRGISSHLNLVRNDLTTLGSRATGAISKVQNQVSHSLAPLGNIAYSVTKAGRSMVGKVPMVNAVANRFTTASNQLARASVKVTGAANAVGQTAETSVTNVMDYAMNTPLSEQSAGGVCSCGGCCSGERSDVFVRFVKFKESCQ